MRIWQRRNRDGSAFLSNLKSYQYLTKSPKGNAYAYAILFYDDPAELIIVTAHTPTASNVSQESSGRKSSHEPKTLPTKSNGYQERNQRTVSSFSLYELTFTISTNIANKYAY
jgi:hypothetical protein